jgi:hypothetical protein
MINLCRIERVAQNRKMTMNSQPKLRTYKRGDRVYVQAQQIWVILVAFIMHSRRNPRRPDTMTYGEVAEKMGYPDPRAGHTLARQLGIIANYCIANGLPALNAIVVGQRSGVPGDEVLLRPRRTVAQEQAAVMQEDWFRIRVPTTGTLRQVWESN